MEGKELRNYKAGAYVYLEDDDDVRTVFLVEDGEVVVSRVQKTIPQYQPRRTKGEIFGFISALSNRPRMENALVCADARVIAFSRDTFITLISKNYDIARKVINYFAEELRLYDKLMLPEGEHERLDPVSRLFMLGKSHYEMSSYEHAYYVLSCFLARQKEHPRGDDAREMIAQMEASGVRQLMEPIKMNTGLHFADGQIVFCEFDRGQELYIIQKGKVKITKSNGNEEVLLSVLKEGDIFGELSILSDKPRNASAIAYGEVELLPVHRDSLAEFFTQSPRLFLRIITDLSQRLWFTFKRIQVTMYKKPVTRVYAYLCHKLQEDRVPMTSNSNHHFGFGLDELLRSARATELSDAGSELRLKELLSDSNIRYNFGLIEVVNPADLFATYKHFRDRDEQNIE